MIIITAIFAILIAASFLMCNGIYKSCTRRAGYEEEAKVANICRKTIPSVLLALLLLIFGIRGIRVVDQTEVGIVRTFGTVTGTMNSGIHFVNPISQKVSMYDLRIHVREAAFATYTKDAQPVEVSVEYQYEPQTDRMMEIASQYGSYEILETKIAKVVEERTKIVIARYSAMPLLENRSNLSFEVDEEVSKLEDTFPVHFTSVVVANLDFSDAFEASVEAKMTAEQDALRAEQEKKTAVVKAEQAKEVAAIEADAAIAKEKGEAEAMKITKEALSSMPDEYIQSMYLEKWDGKLPQIVTEGSGLMLTPSLGG